MSGLMFTIGEVARLAGVTPKTLRHYHHIGLLNEPVRDTNNYRLYSITQLEKVQHIIKLKQFGLSLKQIKTIFEADNPNDLIERVLRQHQRRIHNEIDALQNQLDSIETYLISDDDILNPTQETAPDVSSMTILSDVIKSQATGLSDILIAFEEDALIKMDRYEWSNGYEEFWYQAGKHFTKNLIANERLYIFWVERYLALEGMNADDLQGRAWLQEIRHSHENRLLAQAFIPPVSSVLPEKDQDQITKLLPLLLYEQGSVLQKEFLRALLGM